MEQSSVLLELLERHHTVNKGCLEFRYLGTPLYVATVIAMANGVQILDQSSNFLNELRALRERDELRKELDQACIERDVAKENEAQAWQQVEAIRQTRDETRQFYQNILRDLKNTLRGSSAKMVAPAMAIIEHHLI